MQARWATAVSCLITDSLTACFRILLQQQHGIMFTSEWCCKWSLGTRGERLSVLYLCRGTEQALTCHGGQQCAQETFRLESISCPPCCRWFSSRMLPVLPQPTCSSRVVWLGCHA